MLKILPLIFAMLSSPLMAVELHNASDQQILHELQLRLSLGNGGQQGFTANTRCDHSNLQVSIYDGDFQRIAYLDEYYNSTSTCAEMISALPFGASGRIEAGAQLAYCAHSNLKIYGVLSTGALKALSDTYQGSQSNCWTAMREFNQSRRPR